MEPTSDSSSSSKDERTESRQLVPALLCTGGISRQGQTSSSESSHQIVGSLHLDETTLSQLGQPTAGGVLNIWSELYLDQTIKASEQQFVDVLLFDEWVEGYLIEASDKYTNVLVNHPFLPEENLVEVTRDSIASFRTRTSRSSLTSQLEASLPGYILIDYPTQLTEALESHGFQVSQYRFLQFFAGILPLGCAVLKHQCSESWKELVTNLICPALIAYFHCVRSAPNAQAVLRAWPSVLDAERILMNAVPEGFSLPLELLIEHLETLSSKLCPVYFIKSFKDLAPCCGELVASVQTHGQLQNEYHLEIYGKAALVYLDYCVRTVNWLEALNALVSTLIVNAKCEYPFLSVESLHSFLYQLAPFMFEDPASHIARSSLLRLLFSPPYPAGTVLTANLTSWSLVDTASVQDVLSAAPCSVCIPLLDLCLSSAVSNPFRMSLEIPERLVQGLFLRASAKEIVPLGFVVRGHKALWTMRKGNVGVAAFIQVQRRLFLWICQKTRRLQVMSSGLMREVAMFL